MWITFFDKVLDKVINVENYTSIHAQIIHMHI